MSKPRKRVDAKKDDEKPAEKKKGPGGRPSIYTPELAQRICELVATHSFGLKKLGEVYEDIPSTETINQWRSEKPEFSAMYAEAKRRQADLMAEEIIQIADDGQNDWMETADDQGGTGWKVNGEHVQRSRLRMDARKWLAAKLSPRIYGERQVVENHNITQEKGLKELD